MTSRRQKRAVERAADKAYDYGLADGIADGKAAHTKPYIEALQAISGLRPHKYNSHYTPELDIEEWREIAVEVIDIAEDTLYANE